MEHRSPGRSAPTDEHSKVTAPVPRPPPLQQSPPESERPAPKAESDNNSEFKLGGQTFSLKRVLGRGGMAEVYLADRIGPGGFARKVVVKKILPERAADPLYVQRFIREASLAAQFHHPAIVEILELGNVGADYYIVMEYVDGRNLHDVTKLLREKGQRFPIALAARIVADVASALHYAHNFLGDDGERRRIVHRDVSTTNIMVSFAGQVKLVDFGLAKDIDAQSLTMGDEILGKPLYMPPECLRGGKPSPTWDVYAVGVVLYILLAGRAPFEPGPGSGGMAKLIHDIVSKPPPALDTFYDDIPGPLQEITLRCLSKKPQGRPESAGAVQSVLEAYLASAAPLNTSMVATFIADMFGRDAVGSDPNTSSADLASRDLSVSTDQRSRQNVPPDLVAVAMTDGSPRVGSRTLLVGLVLAAFLVGLGAGFRKEIGLLWQSLRGPSVEEQAQQQAALQPPIDEEPIAEVERPGVISVECNTWGWVAVDGRRIATCPVNPIRIAPGPHVVTLEEKTGTRSRDVVVEEGKTSVVSFVPAAPTQPRQPRVINPGQK